MNKLIIAIMAFFAFSAVNSDLRFEHDGVQVYIPDERDPVSNEPSCLKGKFTGKTGTLKAHTIPIEFTGRYTIGDLDNDGSPDYVVTRKNKMVAYDVCGKKLWRKDGVNTNWENPGHVFWGWSSYGFVGDADGDGKAEFLHIGANERTLYVRDGFTGNIERAIDLGPGQWRYVLLGRRAGEKSNKATRVWLTGKPGHILVQALDIRTSVMRREFSKSFGKITNSYMPPQIANLDKVGGDELVKDTVAISQYGNQLWRHSIGKYSVINAGHTVQVRDIDPTKPGLEATYSVYAPSKGSPSIVNIAYSSRTKFNWLAYSPFSERHPHQHVVGDFVAGNVGLETLVRNGDGRNHWIADYRGRVIARNVRLNSSLLPRHWDGGEIVQGVHWDATAGKEILYTERHVRFKEIPKMIITSSTRPTFARTRFFHGGVDIGKEDTDRSLASKPSHNSWFPFVDRGVIDHFHQDDGPYEGNSHAVDLIGDGREEVIAMGDRKLMIYYNSGDAKVSKRWGQSEYMSRKKLWCHVYNPR